MADAQVRDPQEEADFDEDDTVVMHQPMIKEEGNPSPNQSDLITA